ncbi:unnamed protein product [Ceutorhynchus assimilis]|uniref:Solute carrier family 29 member 3 n=1 Tax=Ceutorhynchus assimilis TaxID=467358 RepID=A0A9N9MBH1_9CUCU|nr:unnamed protein product [Ceutorhynchus assimilis]
MPIPNIKDKYYLTYGIFFLLGILTFIPNYFVITANRYWMFKFRYMGARPEPSEPDADHLGPGPPEDRNVLQTLFPSSYYIVSQLSLLIFIVLTAAYSKKLPAPDKRIFAALLCTLFFYVVNLIFCDLTTDTFQTIFFFILMCIACFLGVCGAVIIVSLVEMVRKFPPEYYTAVLSGQPLCAAISALIQIITTAVTKKPHAGGLVFFIIGTLLVLVTIAIYFFSKRNSQYSIYQIENDAAPESLADHRRLLLVVWAKTKETNKKVKMYMAALVITIGTSAIVYPGFAALVVADKSNGRSWGAWPDMYFVPMITFLMASIFDICGRFLASKIQKSNNQIVLAAAILRIGFIPLLMLCNAQPRLHLPVIFYDIPYMVFISMFCFSNGFLINICITLIPANATDEEEKTSVTILAVMSAVMSAAVFSFISLLLIYLI